MKTLADFTQAKHDTTKLVMLTAYDYPSACLAQEAGADIILVGDSLGMVVLGYDSTVPVTMEDMIHHTKAVRRGAAKTFLITDMPFMSYHSLPQALKNAARLVQAGGCQAVKVEGGQEIVPQVQALVQAGLPVCAHIGLTPQSVTALSGYKVQGRTAQAARKLIDDAKALEQAGAFMLVLECIPTQVAEHITSQVTMPTIGIGAGAACDGQVLVFHDVLGLFDRFTPKFVKQYATLGKIAQHALAQYTQDVRTGAFPGPEHSFTLHEDEVQRLYGK